MTPQASVSSPLKWEDDTHTSQLMLRIKDHACVALRAKTDLTSTKLNSAIVGIIGIRLLPSVSTPRLEAQQADDMPR